MSRMHGDRSLGVSTVSCWSFALAATLLFPSVARTQECPVVEGDGISMWGARQVAIRSALQSTQAQLIIADREVSGDELVKDAVLSTLNGFVQSIEDVDVTQDGEWVYGTFRVCVSAANIGLYLGNQSQSTGGGATVQGDNALARALGRRQSVAATEEMVARLFEGFHDAFFVRVVSVVPGDEEVPNLGVVYEGDDRFDWLSVEFEWGFDPAFRDHVRAGLEELGVLDGFEGQPGYDLSWRADNGPPRNYNDADLLANRDAHDRAAQFPVNTVKDFVEIAKLFESFRRIEQDSGFPNEAGYYLGLNFFPCLYKESGDGSLTPLGIVYTASQSFNEYNRGLDSEGAYWNKGKTERAWVSVSVDLLDGAEEIRADHTFLPGGFFGAVPWLNYNSGLGTYALGGGHRFVTIPGTYSDENNGFWSVGSDAIPDVAFSVLLESPDLIEKPWSCNGISEDNRLARGSIPSVMTPWRATERPQYYSVEQSGGERESGEFRAPSAEERVSVQADDPGSAFSIATASDDFDESLLAQLGSYFSDIENANEDVSIGPMFHSFLGDLPESGRETVSLTFPENERLLFYGVCDNDCEDLDLVVKDAAGNVLAEDTLDDSFPQTVLATGSGGTTVQVEVSMAKCTVEPCYYAVGVSRIN